MAVTTYNRPKQFSWSFSKLKNYAVCPRKHYEVEIAKNFKEPESDILKWGNSVHAAMAQRLLPGKVVLPIAMAEFEPWACKIERKAAKGGKLLVEQKYALNELLQPVEFFARDAWYRGVADVLIVDGEVALAYDWKLGKITEDSQQLALMALCVFSHYPDVQVIHTEFVWLKDNAQTIERFYRPAIPKILANVMPRVLQLKQAYETSTFPEKPSGICKAHCPVTVCEYHGRGNQ